MLHNLRWFITDGLVHLAFLIAPRGAARDRFVQALDDTGKEILEAVENHEKKENEHV